MKIESFDQLSERIIGWGCVVAAATEFINPMLLIIDSSEGAGVGAFGFLLATGRAGVVVRKVGEMLRG